MANSLERSYILVAKEAVRGSTRAQELLELYKGTSVPRRQTRSFLTAIEKQFLVRPAAMLAGMAIECKLKAVIAIDEEPPSTNHDLIAIASKAGLKKLSKDELAVLRELSSMIELGRYHVSKKGKSSFQIGTTAIDAMLRRIDAFVLERTGRGRARSAPPSTR